MRSRIIITGLGFGLLLVLMPALQAAVAFGQDEDAKPFIGDYVFQKVLFGDKEYPLEEIKDAKIRIDDGRITITTPGGQSVVRSEVTPGREGQPSKLMMVVTASPKQERVGMDATGLIEKRGETVWLIYDLQDGRSPKDFKPVDEQQHLIVLEAAKP